MSIEDLETKSFELKYTNNCDFLANVWMTPKQAYRMAEDLIIKANNARSFEDKELYISMCLKKEKGDE